MKMSFINIFKYPFYYPHARGDIESRTALAKFYNKKKLDLNPEQFLIGTTFNQLLSYLLKHFGSEGEVLCPIPRSPLIDEVAHFVGAKIKDYRVEDLDKIEKKIGKKTTAILIQNPHFPTGKTVQEAQWSKVLRLCSSKKIAVISDETQSVFSKQPSTFPSALKHATEKDNVIVIDSVANRFGLPGFKLTWLIFAGKKALYEKELHAIEYLADTFLNLNQLSENLLPDIIQYGKKYSRRFRKLIQKNTETALTKLAKNKHLSVTQPEAGAYLLAQIKNCDLKDEDLTLAWIEDIGIYVHPGSIYQEAKGSIMISLLQDPKTLKTGLKRINNWFRKRDKLN